MAKDEGDTSDEIKWFEDYMTIKQKIGSGGFCKVKAADVTVHRPGKNEGDLIKGVQHMALKVYNKLSLSK